MPKYRLPYVQTRRDAWVEVSLSNIEHNIKLLKSLTNKKSKLLAVVKADAYGHGSAMITPTLLASGVNMLGVASVDEGIQLREAGIEAPILVLGTAPNWSFYDAAKNNIQVSIYTIDHLNQCISTYNRLGKKPEVHIKVDTGMNRIGINHKSALAFIKEIMNTPEIELKGIFTHLACAETLEIANQQKSIWENLISQIPKNDLIIHSANTATLLSYSDMHYDMARAGIGIYGLMPDVPEGATNLPKLKQAMSLRGRIVHIKTVEENSGISYGYSFKTDKTSKIATIPIGYADGVPRALSNKIYGIINGTKVKQVGNITMDQIMFDVSEIDDINTGDIITLLGTDGHESISINEWANILNTINYEITCILKIRLPKVYTRELN